MAKVTILHTNDLHGQLTSAKAAALRPVRAECDLYFDSGDAIKAGNLAIPLGADPVWPTLASLDVSASVPGNRESHVLASAVQSKFSGTDHPVLCANWRHRDGRLLWPESIMLEVRGIRVGVFGVMVPMVTSKMKTQGLSAFLWDSPHDSAKRVVSSLRPQVDLLIALTHIGLPQDRRLAESIPELDLILGGHSHNVLDSPEWVNGVPICQGGSHARYFGRYEWDSALGLTKSELLPWH